MIPRRPPSSNAKQRSRGSRSLSINLQENFPLAELTTLKIGGPARYFVRAESEEDVIGSLDFAAREGLPVFVLGGGSNILISDEGFPGLVLQIGLKGISRSDAFRRSVSAAEAGNETAEAVTLTAHAGEDWDAFVAYCVSQDLAGLECMSGIPGFVGGTPVQNVGAYGQEVAESIVSVRCFDRHTNDIVTLDNADCGFTYRTSIFNTTDRERYIVLAVTYALRPGDEPKLAYKDLAEHFRDATPFLTDVRDAVIAIRRQKSMVIDPADPNSRSAGSFFKNPIVDRSELEHIESEFGPVPFFEFGDKVKIPAAWLIEQAGFPKGFVHRNAGISSNHTLAIVNRGEARAADIVSLKGLIQRAVEEKFGISLVPEPVFVGF